MGDDGHDPISIPPGPTVMIAVSGVNPAAATITVSTPLAMPVTDQGLKFSPAPIVKTVSDSASTAELRCRMCTMTAPWCGPFSTTYPAHIWRMRSEEHTSELQSRRELVCRLLLEKKNAHGNYGACSTEKWCTCD